MTDRKRFRVVSGDTPPVYALPAAEVSREEFRRAQVKAGLASNGDLAALVRMAVAAYEPVPKAPHKCPACRHEVQWLPTRVDVSIRDITVLGVPTLVCSACGTQLPPPVILLAALEEVLEGCDPGVVAFEELV